MTKDQLREALIDVGVKTAVKSKKADLVKLYREHVLHEKVCFTIQSTYAEFRCGRVPAPKMSDSPSAHQSQHRKHCSPSGGRDHHDTKRKLRFTSQVEVVTPNDSLIGGFSSDEEEPMPLDTSHINRETDVKNLTNDEIFFKLKELGETVGPILDSTRSIYEKKLSRVLSDDDDAKDITAFSADEGDDDRDKEADTTDEYEAHSEQIRGTGFNEKIL